MSFKTDLVDLDSDIENNLVIDINDSTNKTVTNGGHDYTEIKFVKNEEGNFVPHSGGDKVKCAVACCGLSALACCAIAVGLFSIIVAPAPFVIPGAIFIANKDDYEAPELAKHIGITFVVWGGLAFLGALGIGGGCTATITRRPE